MASKKYKDTSLAIRNRRIGNILALGGLQYYDKRGKKISALQWSKLLERGQYKNVAHTVVGRQSVSTVWLGLDHNPLSISDKPAIFETMVFPETEICRRYPTIEEALRGHADMVSIITKVGKRFGEYSKEKPKRVDFLELEVKDNARVIRKTNAKSRNSRRVLEILSE